ncbi:MAG: hypothetical protein OEU86_00955 [Gammaproteobacteria bacterium]|nr:hypothetical protein [Gammaproteobacteria bacterium]
MLVSHLLVFITGLAIGYWLAYGRTGSAAPSRSGRDLQRLYKKSPEFFDELRQELLRPEFQGVRDLVILDSPESTFVSEELKLVYYEEELPGLRDLMTELVDAGFIEEVTGGKTPLYMIDEALVIQLQSL